MADIERDCAPAIVTQNVLAVRPQGRGNACKCLVREPSRKQIGRSRLIRVSGHKIGVVEPSRWASSINASPRFTSPCFSTEALHVRPQLWQLRSSETK